MPPEQTACVRSDTSASCVRQDCSFSVFTHLVLSIPVLLRSLLVPVLKIRSQAVAGWRLPTCSVQGSRGVPSHGRLLGGPV